MTRTAPFYKRAAAGFLGASALALAGGTFAYAAAPTQKPPVAASKPSMSKADKQTIKTVDEAYDAVRDIHLARLAIFNGAPNEAKTYANRAVAALTKTKTLAKDYSIETTKKPEAGDAFVPFDSSLALAEGFTPTEQKTATIKKANEHLAKGEQQKAIETLKAGNIDVSLTTALLPANESLKHAETAVKLLGEKQFYEANLALKAIEDSIVISAYDAEFAPKQGAGKSG
ncbi:MAG: YfdX family protein [Parvularculaceae bacterium]